MERGTPDRKDEDYVFRFAIDPRPGATDDPLTDMIRTFMEGFLEVGCFTRHGRDVVVDGFRLNDRKGVTPLTIARRG